MNVAVECREGSLVDDVRFPHLHDAWYCFETAWLLEKLSFVYILQMLIIHDKTHAQFTFSARRDHFDKSSSYNTLVELCLPTAAPDIVSDL